MHSQCSSGAFVAAVQKSVATGSRNLFNTLFLVIATARALHFPSQGNFFRVNENKIHFFLVAFATDF
jgi:hypothetical protein